MQLTVCHVTGFTYEGLVTGSYNEARMSPTASPGQLLLSHRLDVSPTPYLFRYRDYWGSQVTAFEVHEPHPELTVESVSSVQVNRHAPRPAGMSWDEVLRPSVQDQLCEYLEVAPRVQPTEELAAEVAELRARTSGPTELAREVCGMVHDEMAYVVASTQVSSTAADAWQERKGVCQDMAHVCIGALRSVGVPVRYVSGYLHPAKEPVVDETVTGESHAWVEWWDGSWVGFDPTNAQTPDDRYVVVGAGRDYADVAPLSGIFSGGATSSMFVEVSLTRTA
jgi:transglutaminase-like putative cysteine protease